MNNIDDYEMLCVIGRGCFGKIYLVKEVKSGQVYAMKVIKKKLI
jgi:serine/threonine kinase 38